MLFFTFKNADIELAKKKHTWKSYIAIKALLITRQVKFIYKKEFAKTILDNNSKTFIIHITTLKILLVGMLIYLNREA